MLNLYSKTVFGRFMPTQSMNFASAMRQSMGGRTNGLNRMMFFADPRSKTTKTRVNKPKTIAQIKNLQQFVQEKRTLPGESLIESIKKQSRRDEGFNDFFKNFKASEEANWSNIVDLTNIEQDSLLNQKSPEDRRNELVMLEEIRRRKNLQSFRQKQEQIVARNTKAGIDTPIEEHAEEKMQLNDDAEDDAFGSGPERFFQPEDGETFDTADFTLIFMESDSVTQVTRLNRINHRRVLIFIGNGNGVIGYSKGKGLDYQSAFENAFKRMKSNLIAVNIDMVNTSPNAIYARHNDYRIWIYPREKPNYWGSPIIWHMMVLTGLFHCRFVIKSRNKDTYSMLYAYFAAVCRNKTPQMMAEHSGAKLHKQVYADTAQNAKAMF